MIESIDRFNSGKKLIEFFLQNYLSSFAVQSYNVSVLLRNMYSVLNAVIYTIRKQISRMFFCIIRMNVYDS